MFISGISNPAVQPAELEDMAVQCSDPGETAAGYRGLTPGLWKTAAVYAALAAAAIAVNNIYALFAHGVSSAAMTWMFLYPLLGGSLAYLLLLLLFPEAGQAPGYRLFSNAYNSGIAALTAGSLLKGILDIAGTGSPYTAAFYGLGGCLVMAGTAGLAAYVFRRSRKASGK